MVADHRGFAPSISIHRVRLGTFKIQRQQPRQNFLIGEVVRRDLVKAVGLFFEATPN